eukprot:4490926-Pleurochrysis_carterae.AAC.1
MNCILGAKVANYQAKRLVRVGISPKFLFVKRCRLDCLFLAWAMAVGAEDSRCQIKVDRGAAN